jgi:polyhydroxybutyrate depolymerase
MNSSFKVIAVAFAYASLLTASLSHAAEGCATFALKRGWQVVTVHSGDLNREVPVYVPASVAGGVPLVFDLHGSGGNGRRQARLSGLSAQADRHGFLLANPNGGIADPKNPTDEFYWHVPGVPLIDNVPTPPGAPDDVQFFRDAIEQIEHLACPDPRRIYVTGFSGGGRMASALACELADRIAAIAPVSGLRAGAPRESDRKTPDAMTCAPRRSISIMTFHGVHDPVNRYDGDETSRWGYGVLAALGRWANLDRCRASPAEQRISEHVTKVTFLHCADAAELILYRTDAPLEHGGGHIWPHPSAPSPESAEAVEQVDQLNASELIWEFFARHRS